MGQSRGMRRGTAARCCRLLRTAASPRARWRAVATRSPRSIAAALLQHVGGRSGRSWYARSRRKRKSKPRRRGDKSKRRKWEYRTHKRGRMVHGPLATRVVTRRGSSSFSAGEGPRWAVARCVRRRRPVHLLPPPPPPQKRKEWGLPTPDVRGGGISLTRVGERCVTAESVGGNGVRAPRVALCIPSRFFLCVFHREWLDPSRTRAAQRARVHLVTEIRRSLVRPSPPVPSALQLPRSSPPLLLMFSRLGQAWR